MRFHGPGDGILGFHGWVRGRFTCAVSGPGAKRSKTCSYSYRCVMSVMVQVWKSS